MKHKNTQPLYIFNRENPKNSEPQNGPRSGLDYIALVTSTNEGAQIITGHMIYNPAYTYLQIITENQQSLGKLSPL